MRNRVLILLAILALAGPGSTLKAAEPFVRTPYAVADSHDVTNIRVEIDRTVKAGSYDAAALHLQRILDYFSQTVVLTGPEERQQFVGARLWVHRFLHSLPKEAHVAYRKMAGPPADELLARATRDRDENLLLEVVRRFYLSGKGPSALRALATLCLVEGRFEDAAHYLGAIEGDFADEFGKEDEARLAFSLVRGADHVGYRKLLGRRPGLTASKSPVLVGGRVIPLADFLRPLADRLAASPQRPLRSESSWPIYGGTPDRVAPAASTAVTGTPVWLKSTSYRVKDDDYTYGGSRYYSNYSTLSPVLIPDFFPMHPVVHGGTAFFHNGGTIYASNLLTGKEEWYWNGPLVSSIDGKTNPGTLMTLAVNDRIVVANLEIPVPNLPPREVRMFQNRTVIFPIPQRRLFALDRRTGQLLWDHSDDSIEGRDDEPELAHLNVSGAPLIIGDTLYVSASRLDNRYFCYVLALEAATGRVKWRTRVCTGQAELNLFGRIVKELAPSAVSEREGVLYFVTNLGVAAALDRRTGSIKWIKGYPQVPIPLAITWHSPEERETTFANAPPIVTEDTLYFTATDSWDLVALDIRDGSLKFLYPDGYDGWRGPKPRHLLGVGEKYLYLAGRQVTAVDKRTGKLAWRTTRGRFLTQEEGSPEEARGRGLLTDDAVLTMTQSGLYAFDPVTGERLAFTPMPALSRSLRGNRDLSGGNLVHAAGVLLVAGRENIGAFYSTEKIHAQLKERAREDPDNPGLAVELGDIYATWRKFDDALKQYRRALHLVGRLPPADREPVVFAAKRGLFTIHLGEGRREWRNAAEAEDPAKAKSLRSAAARHFRAALDSAMDKMGKVEAILALSRYHLASGKQDELRKLYKRMEQELPDVVFEFEAQGLIPAGLYASMHLAELAREADKPERAIGHFLRIISRYPGHELAGNVESQIFAREEIARLIRSHGREVYSAIEKRAATQMADAITRRDIAELLVLTDRFPNSRAAAIAVIEAAKFLIADGAYRRAAIALRRFLADFPEATTAPMALYLLAASLESREYLESARSALFRLGRRYPDAEIEVDGRRVKAGAYAKGRLDEEKFRKLAAGSKKLRLPLERLWVENEGANEYARVLEPAGIAPPGTEGNLLIGTNGLVRCMDAVHHRPLWHKPVNGIVTRPVFSEGNLILVNSASIQAVDPDTGTKRWEVQTNASLRAVATNSGLVFVLTADFHRPRDLTLKCLSPRNGEVAWQRRIEDHQIYDVLFIAEEAIGIASIDPAGVTVFDTATGRLRYRVNMRPRTLGRMPRLLDGDKLAIVKGPRRVVLYDLPTGKLVWEHPLPSDRLFKVGIPTDGAFVYSDTRDQIVCLDLRTGKVRWAVPPETAPKKRTTLVADGDNGDETQAYTIRKREADGAYFVTARKLTDGKIVWRKEILKSRNANFSTIVSEQYLIAHVNSFDFGLNAWTSKTYILDKDNGKALQEIKVDEMQGFYANVGLFHGLLTFNARGRVGVYGSK